MSILPGLAPLVTTLLEKGGRAVAIILAIGLVTSAHLLILAHYVIRPLMDLSRKEGGQ